MTESPSKFILLVDDDVDCHEAHRRFLEIGGYRVRCCLDPEEALAAMQTEKPDLVITDLMMSSLDAGFDFSRRVKETPGWEHIPIIVLTAVGSRLGYDFHPRTPADLAAMNADGFLTKPVAPETLLAKVRELLGRLGT